MKDTRVLVIGASGTVGQELVRQLKQAGAQVRATTSKAVKPTSELVTINLATGEGVGSAMEGIDRAFFLSPPGHADQYSILAPLIQEAKRRGLKKVVLMTAMGANANEASPFRRSELELERSGLSYNIIRPNWFLQNFNSFWVRGIREQKKIQLPAGTAGVSFIDARDIAAVAAKLLLNDEYANQAFDLTGPTAVNHAQVAEAISRVTQQNVKYEEIQPEVLKTGLLSAGLPADYVDFMLLIFGFLREGYSAPVNGNVKLLTGRDARSLSDYANDFKQAWL